MSALKKELVDSTLKGLKDSSSFEGAAVVSRDGLLISSMLSGGVDAETFAAMSATMMGAAETAVSELKKGSLERIIVESLNSKIIAVGAGSTSILVAMTGPKVNLGFVLIELDKAVKQIAQTLS